MTQKRRQLSLVAASLLSLVGLALVCWSVLDPRPLPVIIAMSVAQGIGTLSLFIFGLVVLNDLRRKRVLEEPPPEEEKAKK